MLKFENQTILLSQNNKQRRENSVIKFSPFFSEIVNTLQETDYCSLKYRSKELMSNIPKWLVANCSSILSWESLNGVAITPALLLTNKQQRYNMIFFCVCVFVPFRGCRKIYFSEFNERLK